MAYFLRPERNARMKRIVGEGTDDSDAANMTAWEWETKKTMAFVTDEKDNVLVNRREVIAATRDVMS
jgi:hypothetical protein